MWDQWYPSPVIPPSGHIGILTWDILNTEDQSKIETDILCKGRKLSSFRNTLWRRNNLILAPLELSSAQVKWSCQPHHHPDAYTKFQDLLRRIIDLLQIPLKEVQDTPHKRLYIFQNVGPSKMALPINEAISEPAKMVWHTPATCAPTLKRTQKKYCTIYL